MRTVFALILAVLILAVLPVAAQDDLAVGTPVPDLNTTPAETPVATPDVTPTETPVPPPDTLVPPGPGRGIVLAPQAPPPSLDITVDPASVSFGGPGGMLVPDAYHAWVNVTVQAQGVKDWFLRAEDTTAGTTHKGFLSSTSPARNLSRPLEIWDFTLVPERFRAVGTGNSIWYSSTKPGKSEVITRFRQGTATDDLYGVYSMTVSFTASTS